MKSALVVLPNLTPWGRLPAWCSRNHIFRAFNREIWLSWSDRRRDKRFRTQSLEDLLLEAFDHSPPDSRGTDRHPGC